MADEVPSGPDETTRLAFHERGGGGDVPLLFVHGVDDDSSCWDPVIDELQNETRCVAVDLPGHGMSPTPTDPDAYRREAVLDAIDLVLDSIGPAILVGHSLGGYLGLAHSLSRPGILRGLVLVATGPGFRDAQSRERWNDRVRANASEYRVREIAATLALHEDSHVIDHLAEVTVPVALVIGSEDRAFVGANDYLERKLVTAERTTIEGGRHFVMRSHPEEVSAAIRRLIQRV
jgi:pimeloyl-ACP methyl ester carboxylesterase